MCGHVGVAGRISQKEETVFKQLLVVDSLRGIDSTGVARIHRDTHEVSIIKAVGDTFQLMDTKSFDSLTKGFSNVLIGHNRFSTVGKSTKANAHPYEFENIVGAHNGTLTNKWQIPGHADFNVDSQALFSHMDKKGVKETLSIIRGAWALVWWDKADNSINFLRNKERTLYITFNKANDCMFWASEEWMLTGILGRNNVEHSKPTLLTEDVHLSIVIDEKGKMDKPRAIMCPSTAKDAPVTNQASAWSNSANTQHPVSKNERVAPVTAATKVVTIGSKSGLAGSKQLVLEVLSHVERDNFGSPYLTCHSTLYPYAKIRWYYNRSLNYMDYIGEEIIADIHEGRVEVGSQDTYYKVLASSVKLVEQVVEEEDEGEYEDYRGNKLGFNSWMEKHGECSWCGGYVLPTENHSFSSAGDVVCKDCMQQDDVKPFLTKLIAGNSVH